MNQIRFAALTGLFFAALQSICTAYLALSGIRVAIGLTALAAAGGTYELPKGIHQDAIRIPMMILGGMGAVINLTVLVRIWRLRRRQSGNWRRRTISTTERRSERVQLAISILTLLLLTAELVTHKVVHRSRPAGLQMHSQSQPVRKTFGSVFFEDGIQPPMKSFTVARGNFKDTLVSHEYNDVSC